MPVLIFLLEHIEWMGTVHVLTRQSTRLRRADDVSIPQTVDSIVQEQILSYLLTQSHDLPRVLSLVAGIDSCSEDIDVIVQNDILNLKNGYHDIVIHSMELDHTAGVNFTSSFPVNNSDKVLQLAAQAIFEIISGNDVLRDFKWGFVFMVGIVLIIPFYLNHFVFLH